MIKELSSITSSPSAVKRKGAVDLVNLDFSMISMVGREAEIAALESSSSNLIWVQGYSGAGKSFLIHHVFGGEAYFSCGKFEQIPLAAPFSALVEAISMLCDKLCAANIKLDINNEVQATLVNAVPKCSSIVKNVLVPTPTRRRSSYCSSLTDFKSDIGGARSNGFSRFKEATQQFLEIASEAVEEGIVLFLDDLHWADQDTLSILEYILTSQKPSSKIKIIASFRDNVINEDHLLSLLLSKLDKHNVNSTSIQVPSFAREHLDELLDKLFSDHKPETTKDLSELIYRKTNGNPFFAIQLIKLLEQKQLLYLSIRTFKWTWDLPKIRLQDISENVAECILERIRKLPRATQQILKVAACLGSRADLATVEGVMDIIWGGGAHSEKNQNKSLLPTNEHTRNRALYRILQDAAMAGIIDIQDETGRFKFSHDRCQQAVYELIPEGRGRQSLHLELGLYLQSKVRDEGADSKWKLELAVDQLNRASPLITLSKKRLELAKLNLQAARSVMQSNACVLALGFLKSGIELLGDTAWSSYYLALDLNIGLATVQYYNGDIETCLDTIYKVYLHAQRVEDKHKIFRIHVEALIAFQRLDEALIVGKEILRELEHQKVPQKPGLHHVIFGALRIARLMPPGEQILNLPEMTDRRLLTVQQILGLLTTAAFFKGENILMPILANQILEISLIYGEVSEHTSFGLGNFAFGESVQNKFESSRRYLELAKKMMNRFPGTTRSLLVIYGVLEHIRTPLQDCLDPLLDVWQSGFSLGDMQFASQSVNLYLISYFCSGLALEPLSRDIRSFSKHLLRYKQTLMNNSLMILQRCVDILRDEQGPHFLCDDSYEFQLQQGGMDAYLTVFQVLTMMVRFQLGDIAFAIKLAKKCWKSGAMQGALPYSSLYFFYSALIALDWSKQTKKKRKYTRIFKKFYCLLKKWDAMGVVNCGHLVPLLDTEALIMKEQSVKKWSCKSVDARTPGRVKESYNRAIAVASRSGCLNVATLANERAGLYCYQPSIRDKFWGETYMERSSELYEEWGATKKTQLQSKGYRCCDSSSEVSGRSISIKSGYFRGRARFDSNLEQQHTAPILSFDVDYSDQEPAAGWSHSGDNSAKY